MKQKVEITFEVEKTIVRRQAEKVLTGFCPQCRASVEIITPPIAVALTGLSGREIFRLIENGRLPFVEAGRVFVCRNSRTDGTEETLNQLTRASSTQSLD